MSLKINYIAPINITSYGLGASYFLFNLIIRDYQVALFPIGPLQVPYGFMQQAINKAINNKATFDINAISFRKYHPHDMGERCGKVCVGYTIFEWENLKEVEKHHLNSLDVVISPTQWQTNVLSNNNIKAQLYTVPLGVDTNIFKPMDINIPNKPFIFLTIGKYEYRKNYKQLLEAFDKAFEITDNVELHIIAHSAIPQLQQRADKELSSLVSQMKLGSKVKVYPKEFIDPISLCKIINLSDCGISVSHAEGFNLTLLEMLAVGKPVIATNVTGHTQYLDSNRCICQLIEPIGKEPAIDPLVGFNGEHEWYTFSTDNIIESLRFAYQNYYKKIFTENIQLAKQYDWVSSTDKLVQVLQQL